MACFIKYPRGDHPKTLSLSHAHTQTRTCTQLRTPWTHSRIIETLAYLGLKEATRPEAGDGPCGVGQTGESSNLFCRAATQAPHC
jgi:hypothetical protein